jgi:hypothetical protein
MSEAVSAFC